MKFRCTGKCTWKERFCWSI